MFINPKLFLKLFMGTVAGAIPLIHYVIPSDLNTREQRLFKWFLNWDQEDNTKETLTKESDKYLVKDIKKHKWQGLHEEQKLKKLLTSIGGKKNIYKLFFKSEVIQKEGEIKNGKGLKAAIGLAKISLGGGQEITIEEIKEEEAKKVLLIIAKGKNSIYLMPAVWSEKPNNVEKKIWEEGVNEISEWENNTQLEKWDISKDTLIKESLKNGFVIVRSSEIIGEGSDKREARFEEYNFWFNSKQKTSFGFGGWQIIMPETLSGTPLYQNASIVLGREKKEESNSRYAGWSIEVETWNKKIENFFPLDIQVMGDKKLLKEKNSGKIQITQEIEIDDSITQVIGVRLDQVVISETGIGRDVNSEIKWDNSKKPTWTSKLLK